MSCPWALVAVHWIDAYDSSNGWIELDDYKPQVANVVTIGYLYPDCLPGYLTVTASYFPDEIPNLKTVGMLTHIPSGMVQKIRILEQPQFNLF